jgi:hypothetical protein
MSIDAPPIEQDEPDKFCKHCFQKLVRINFTGFAGKGEPHPYKHKLPMQVPCPVGPTLKESETTEDNPAWSDNT